MFRKEEYDHFNYGVMTKVPDNQIYEESITKSRRKRCQKFFIHPNFSVSNELFLEDYLKDNIGLIRVYYIM